MTTSDYEKLMAMRAHAEAIIDYIDFPLSTSPTLPVESGRIAFRANRIAEMAITLKCVSQEY